MDSLEKVKILMVDDEPKNLLALEAVLESLDQTLVRANSGKEALRCLLNDDFALILLDVQMPEMDGFEFASMVRAREKNRYIPIIFLTAVGKTEAEMFRGYEAGAVDYMLKPFAPAVLRYKVSILVDIHQKTAEIERLNARLKLTNASLEVRVRERTADLEERSQDLLRSNQELAQFAAVASHDLQEPLRTMSMYLQLLSSSKSIQFTTEDSEFMGIVLDAAKRMRQLIHDLLAFSQVGEGARKLVAVDCGRLVTKTLALLQTLIDEKGVKVTVGVLPTIDGEPLLLSQLFQNLIENAIKFQPGAGPTVDIAVESKDGNWIFSIKDGGIGIRPEHFEKIFKLFQRLHSRDHYAGSGMGLSICKKVVERHGGKIWLDSAPDRGSTFYFSIPQKGHEHGSH